ncbi:hypothetical protein KKF84_13790, partial [Myxococcota bacterium]|nr:hypothetical protein [Myxococcota bacterium]
QPPVVINHGGGTAQPTMGQLPPTMKSMATSAVIKPPEFAIAFSSVHKGLSLVIKRKGHPTLTVTAPYIFRAPAGTSLTLTYRLKGYTTVKKKIVVDKDLTETITLKKIPRSPGMKPGKTEPKELGDGLF